MYVTAHRVRRHQSGEVGINAFLHLHYSPPPDWLDWNQPDFSRAIDEWPAHLNKMDCDVPPGGNSVMSYLDVLAEDSVEVAQIRAAFDEASMRLKHEKPPLVIGSGKISVRFVAVATTGLNGAEQLEFITLGEALVNLVEQWQQNPAE